MGIAYRKNSRSSKVPMKTAEMHVICFEVEQNMKPLVINPSPVVVIYSSISVCGVLLYGWVYRAISNVK